MILTKRRKAMRILHGTVLVGGLLLVVSLVAAQPPAGDSRKTANSSEAERFVARMMALNKNQDGKLTKDEVTDTRLHRLFDRADANKDGVVTKEELLALFAKENPQPGAGDFCPPDGVAL